MLSTVKSCSVGLKNETEIIQQIGQRRLNYDYVGKDDNWDLGCGWGLEFGDGDFRWEFGDRECKLGVGIEGLALDIWDLGLGLEIGV